MAKFTNPTSFTSYFRVDPGVIEKAGAFDPLLNVDTRLFIDPLLLGLSSAAEIRSNAVARQRQYFEGLLKVLRGSQQEGDAAWRQARRLMSFSEIAATCLGYGAASIRGSGFGPEKRDKVLRTAKEIINLGVDDPSIFLLIPLLEESIGPDLISDMTTRIILPDLAQYTRRVLSQQSVGMELFTVNGEPTGLPRNPFQSIKTPVVLVPKDVLARLPIATDWSEVADSAAQNDALRVRVNRYIGNIWASKTRKDKSRLRANVLRSKAAVEALLALVIGATRTPYDFDRDPLGVAAWRELLGRIAQDEPLDLAKPQTWTPDSVEDLVRKIIAQFQFLVQSRGLSRLLWHDNTPHREEVVQRLFFAVAYSYCQANNLDITPEADTGTGVVDFKIAGGFTSRVLVETKLSNNRKLLHGYEKQLEAYRMAEQTTRAFYIVIDVGGMAKKDVKLVNMRNEQTRRGIAASELVFINGFIQPPASLL
jgi:hypothetical protein